MNIREQKNELHNMWPDLQKPNKYIHKDKAVFTTNINKLTKHCSATTTNKHVCAFTKLLSEACYN